MFGINQITSKTLFSWIILLLVISLGCDQARTMVANVTLEEAETSAWDVWKEIPNSDNHYFGVWRDTNNRWRIYIWDSKGDSTKDRFIAKASLKQYTHGEYQLNIKPKDLTIFFSYDLTIEKIVKECIQPQSTVAGMSKVESEVEVNTEPPPSDNNMRMTFENTDENNDQTPATSNQTTNTVESRAGQHKHIINGTTYWHADGAPDDELIGAPHPDNIPEGCRQDGRWQIVSGGNIIQVSIVCDEVN